MIGGNIPPLLPRTVVTGTAGTTITAGQVLYLSGGTIGTAGWWYPAQANNTNTSEAQVAIGIAAANATTGTNVAVVLIGSAKSAQTLTTGFPYYIDPNTAGALTSTSPPLYPRFVGQADSPTSLVVGPGHPPRIQVPQISTTGTLNDVVPVASSYVGTIALLMSNSSLTTITGFSAVYVTGQRMTINAIGTGQVDLLHQNAGSLAANRLFNLVTSGPTSLAPGGSAEYIYDGTFWRLLSHVQGGAISPAFNPANFGISGGGTWTVAGATVYYYLTGRMLTVGFQAQGTVGGSGNFGLLVFNGTYGGYTAKSNYWFSTTSHAFDSATLLTTPTPITILGTNSIQIAQNNGTNWTAGGTTTVSGEISFEVT